MLYTDREPALQKKQVTKYLDDEAVHLIMTMTHAAVAERQIRTVKRMIADRMRERPEGERYYHNQEFLDSLTAIYNAAVFWLFCALHDSWVQLELVTYFHYDCTRGT